MLKRDCNDSGLIQVSIAVPALAVVILDFATKVATNSTSSKGVSVQGDAVYSVVLQLAIACLTASFLSGAVATICIYMAFYTEWFRKEPIDEVKANPIGINGLKLLFISIVLLGVGALLWRIGDAWAQWGQLQMWLGASVILVVSFLVIDRGSWRKVYFRIIFAIVLSWLWAINIVMYLVQGPYPAIGYSIALLVFTLCLLFLPSMQQGYKYRLCCNNSMDWLEWHQAAIIASHRSPPYAN